MYPEEVPLYLKRIAERKKAEALEKIADWSMLLEIAVAPHTEKGVGVRRVDEHLKRIRAQIEQGVQTPEVDLEFHRKLVDLNKRRRERRAG